MSLNNPIARKEKLVVQEMPDEVLVYDLETHKAHCLNPMAAAVWNKCDGQRTTGEIAVLMKEEGKHAVNEEVVWLAVKQLSKANLLQAPVVHPENGGRFSRREVIRKLGLAATVTLPLVTTILAPTAVQAGTCTTNTPGCLGNGSNNPCLSNAACCSCCCLANNGHCVANNPGSNCLP